MDDSDSDKRYFPKSQKSNNVNTENDEFCENVLTNIQDDSKDKDEFLKSMGMYNTFTNSKNEFYIFLVQLKYLNYCELFFFRLSVYK